MYPPVRQFETIRLELALLLAHGTYAARAPKPSGYRFLDHFRRRHRAQVA